MNLGSSHHQPHFLRHEPPHEGAPRPITAREHPTATTLRRTAYPIMMVPRSSMVGMMVPFSKDIGIGPERPRAYQLPPITVRSEQTKSCRYCDRASRFLRTGQDSWPSGRVRFAPGVFAGIRGNLRPRALLRGRRIAIGRIGITMSCTAPRFANPFPARRWRFGLSHRRFVYGGTSIGR